MFVRRPLNDGLSGVWVRTAGSELQRRALLGFSTSISIPEQLVYKTEEHKAHGNSNPADFLASFRMGTFQETFSLPLLRSEFYLETKSRLAPYITQL